MLPGEVDHTILSQLVGELMAAQPQQPQQPQAQFTVQLPSATATATATATAPARTAPAKKIPAKISTEGMNAKEKEFHESRQKALQAAKRAKVRTPTRFHQPVHQLLCVARSLANRHAPCRLVPHGCRLVPHGYPTTLAPLEWHHVISCSACTFAYHCMCVPRLCVALCIALRPSARVFTAPPIAQDEKKRIRAQIDADREHIAKRKLKDSKAKEKKFGANINRHVPLQSSPVLCPA